MGRAGAVAPSIEPGLNLPQTGGTLLSILFLPRMKSMFPEYAKKFAHGSLRLFKREGRFEIDVPQGLDLEDIAREYESYGHAVERDARNGRLSVICAA